METAELFDDQRFETTYASLSGTYLGVLAQYRMPTAEFNRIAEAGVERKLPLLEYWLEGDEAVLLVFKQEAEAFARELRAVRSALDDRKLRQHVDALVEMTDQLGALPSDSGARLAIESGWIGKWEDG